MTVTKFGYNKAMVVGDSMLIRVLTSDTIRNIMPDCAVVESDNGIDAVKKYAEIQPDIVLDIDMPEADGFVALNLIKRKQKDAKVIMMTADQREETREKAARLGASGFLTKPFNNNDLINTLKEL